MKKKVSSKKLNISQKDLKIFNYLSVVWVSTDDVHSKLFPELRKSSVLRRLLKLKEFGYILESRESEQRNLKFWFLAKRGRKELESRKKKKGR